MALAVVQQDWARALEVLRRSHGGWLVFGTLSISTGLVFLAARWRSLMPVTQPVTLGPLTAILTSATLLNYALPGPVGEFAAAVMAGRRFGIQPEQAFAANVHARFVGLALSGVVALLLYLGTDIPVPPEYHSAVGWASGSIAFGTLVLFALSAKPGLLRAVSHVLIGPWFGRWREPLLARVVNLADALAAVGRLGPQRYAVASAWAIGGHLCVIVGLYMFALGFGETPHAGGLAFTYTMTTAGAVLLFAFPGSQVAWDAMLTTLLVFTAGLSTEVAVAVTVVARAQQFLIVALGAVALVGNRA